jgi:type VI protein secretion system component Hcp
MSAEDPGVVHRLVDDGCINPASRRFSMKRSAMWIAAVLVLVATPAVLGLVVLRDNDGAGDRRQAALGPVDPGTPTDTLVIPPITSTSVGIIVESYSWGLNVPYAYSPTSGATSGRATFQPLTITKGLDATSAGLFLQAAKGLPLASAILRLNGGNGGMYELSNVFISEVSHAGGKEQLSLNYSKIKFTAPTGDKGAGTGSVPSGTWDIATAKAS